MFDLIVAAGGSSSRCAAAKNKLLLSVNGRTVIENAVLPFLSGFELNRIIVAVSEPLFDEVSAVLSPLSDKIFLVVGGSTRTESVKNALTHVTAPYVLIHDGARPFISADVIRRVISALDGEVGVVPVIPISDTLAKTVDGYETVLRSDYSLVQTPQGFPSDKLKTAYANASGEFTDDASVYETVAKITSVSGDAQNKKITTLKDLNVCSARVGTGFDTHRLVEGRKLILGGVEIPYHKGLLGHSDADVLTHAVMDALLSAAGLHDIGRLFPTDDDKYLGASSISLLTEVVKWVSGAGYSVQNVTATVIAEAPKLAPYTDEIKDVFARTLNIEKDAVGLAATTTEGMFNTGRGEAISAIAYVSLI
jgi:2-C-methyl-D-erythritol 2,4-cyclodiphosphate synthase